MTHNRNELRLAADEAPDFLELLFLFGCKDMRVLVIPIEFVMNATKGVVSIG